VTSLRIVVEYLADTEYFGTISTCSVTSDFPFWRF